MADFEWLNYLQKNNEGSSITNLVNRAVDWWIEPREEEITDLKLHIIGTETMTLEADVTDYYVENNIAYQDHIALKPKMFTVVGEVGELTWFKKEDKETVMGVVWDNGTTPKRIGAVPQKLTQVVSFLPPISKQANAIQDKTLKVLGILDSVDNFANRIINLLSNEDVDNEQKKIYKYLMTMWQERRPIDIRTPYGKMFNYVIKSVEFTQPDRTRDKSQIKIAFKEFKTVIEKRSRLDKKKLQGRKSAQQSAKQQKGTTSGVTMSREMCKPGSIAVDPITGVCFVAGKYGE